MPSFCRRAVESCSGSGATRRVGQPCSLSTAYHRHDDVFGRAFRRDTKENFYGYFEMAKAAVPHMDNGAAIINIGSVTGSRGLKHCNRLVRQERHCDAFADLGLRPPSRSQPSIFQSNFRWDLRRAGTTPSFARLGAPISIASLWRARLRRLLTVPIAQPKWIAASS